MAAPKKKSKPRVAATTPKREKKKPGPPPHEPTQQQRAIVERAALTGKLTHDEIGALIGVSDVTLRKHYATELAVGKNKTTVAVLNSFLENCIGVKPQAARKDEKGNIVMPAVPGRPGDVNAQKFYLERFADMVQKTEVDVKGKLALETPPLSKLSDDELEKLEKKLGSRMAVQPSSTH